VKKAVVCVAHLVAALITVRGLLSFFSDVYVLFDLPAKTLWLSRRLPVVSRTRRNVYHFVVMEGLRQRLKHQVLRKNFGCV